MVASSPQGRLPSGYREVEWLQGSGTQYCVTSYNPVVGNSRNNSHILKGNATFLNFTTAQFTLGSHWKVGQTDYFYSIASYQNKIYYRNGSVTPSNTHMKSVSLTTLGTAPLDVYYEIDYNNIKANGTTINITPEQFESTSPLVIGGYYGEDSYVLGDKEVKIKAFSLYLGDTLVSEFIPCYRKSDNKTGFYETGTHTFLPNLGEGAEWIMGNVVE